VKEFNRRAQEVVPAVKTLRGLLTKV